MDKGTPNMDLIGKNMKKEVRTQQVGMEGVTIGSIS